MVVAVPVNAELQSLFNSVMHDARCAASRMPHHRICIIASSNDCGMRWRIKCPMAFLFLSA
jgi:hypothetical protein